MTKEQLEKATELSKKTKYYKEKLTDLEFQVGKKYREDKEIKEDEYKRKQVDKNMLNIFSIIRFKKNKDKKEVVNVVPYYYGNFGVEFEVEEELVMLIINWLENRIDELEKEIEKI